MTHDRKTMSSSPHTVRYYGKYAVVDLGTGAIVFNSDIVLSREQLSTHRDNCNGKYYNNCWADKHTNPLESYLYLKT